MPKKRTEPPLSSGDVPALELQARFGENLRNFRRDRGLTQAQVAELSGIEQTEISKIERGQINVTLNTMQRLAKVVDHDVSNLLSESPVSSPKK